MLEKDFLDSMEVCRWESLAAVHADIALLAEGFLRSHAPREQDRMILADYLTDSFRTNLGGFPIPVHRSDRGWEHEVTALRERLAQAQLAQPKHPKDVGHTCGPILYDVMPIHSNMMQFDKELIVNSVRFQFIRVHEDMTQIIDSEAVVRDILGGAATH